MSLNISKQINKISIQLRYNEVVNMDKDTIISNNIRKNIST